MANPTAILLCASNMLAHIGLNQQAERIRNAVKATIRARKVSIFCYVLLGSLSVSLLSLITVRMAKQCIVLVLSIRVCVCLHGNWKLLIKNWCNLVKMCVMANLKVTRFWWYLTLTFKAIFLLFGPLKNYGSDFDALLQRSLMCVMWYYK